MAPLEVQARYTGAIPARFWRWILTRGWRIIWTIKRVSKPGRGIEWSALLKQLDRRRAELMEAFPQAMWWAKPSLHRPAVSLMRNLYSGVELCEPWWWRWSVMASVCLRRTWYKVSTICWCYERWPLLHEVRRWWEKIKLERARNARRSFHFACDGAGSPKSVLKLKTILARLVSTLTSILNGNRALALFFVCRSSDSSRSGICCCCSRILSSLRSLFSNCWFWRSVGSVISEVIRPADHTLQIHQPHRWSQSMRLTDQRWFAG